MSAIVISTLLVLLNGSSTDFLELWETSGPVNDPTGDKHTYSIRDIISGGNFRSLQIENWLAPTSLYDTVTITGRNVWGDVLWVSEFNVSGTSWKFSEWATDNRLVSSSANPSTQHVVISDQFYSVRLDSTSATGNSWFAITFGQLEWTGTPQFFIARDSTVPFKPPVILTGYQGCWPASALNITQVGTDVSQSSAVCSAACGHGPGVAAIELSTICYCGQLMEGATGRDDASCYVNCPGNGSEKCGGFVAGWYSVYFYPGYQPVGYVPRSLVFTDTFFDVELSVQLDIASLSAYTGDPAYITTVGVTTPGGTSYQIHYSQESCLTATFQSLGAPVAVSLVSDGTKNHVDVLLIRCLKLIFDAPVTSATIYLYGMISTDHIPVPVVSVEGSRRVTATGITTLAATTPGLATTTITTQLTNGASSTAVSVGGTPTTETTSSTITPSLTPTTTSPNPTTTTTSPGLTATTSPSPTTTTTSPGPTTTTTSPGPTTTTSTPSLTATTSPSPTTTTTSPGPTTTTSTPSLTATTSPSPTTTTTSPGPTTTTTSPGPTTTTTSPGPTTTTTSPSPTTTTTSPGPNIITSTQSLTSTTSNPSPTTTTTSQGPTSTTVTQSPTATTINPSPETSAANLSSTNAPSSTRTTTTANPTTTTATDPTIPMSYSSTIITSDQTTKQTTTAVSTTTKCQCECNANVRQSNITGEELQAKIESIKKHLTVNKTDLSSHIRRKTSAEDNRPAAVSIGAVGVTLLVSVFVAIVLIDSATLWRDFHMLIRNIQQGLCRRS